MAKKFERKEEQKTPSNPTGNRNIEPNDAEDIGKETIRKQEKKKE